MNSLAVLVSELQCNTLDSKLIERCGFTESVDDVIDGVMKLKEIKILPFQLDDLYLIAIVHRRDVKSLRDLAPDHLPLLKNIREKGLVSTDALTETTGLSERFLNRRI